MEAFEARHPAAFWAGTALGVCASFGAFVVWVGFDALCSWRSAGADPQSDLRFSPVDALFRETLLWVSIAASTSGALVGLGSAFLAGLRGAARVGLALASLVGPCFWVWLFVADMVGF